MGNIPPFLYVIIAILTAITIFLLVVRPRTNAATQTAAAPAAPVAASAPAPAAATSKRQWNLLAIGIGLCGFAVFVAIAAITVIQPTGLNDIDLFWWIAVVTIICVLTVGSYKYWPIAGNTSVYILLGVIGFLLIFGTLYVAMKKVAPLETEMILEAAQNDIRSAAKGIVTNTSPYGHTAIDWKQIGDLEWGKFFGILFFGLCVIGFGIFLLKGHKIATFLFVVTASAVVLPTAFYLSWTNVVPKPVQEFVTGAATTVYEANPALGENHFVNLRAAPDHKLVVANIGPYDTLTVSVPDGSHLDWQAYPGYERVPGYDPNGYYLYNTTGSSGFTRHYAFTEEFKDGLITAGRTLTLEIWAVK